MATYRYTLEQSPTEAELAEKDTVAAAEVKIAPEPVDNENEIQCDWICCKPKFCQWFARPSCLLIWLSVISYAQGMLLNGFLNSVLTSIERRFDLASVETGMIASTYDIGACLAIVPITYYGRRYRRSRFISIGALVVATGSFLFSSPYFIAGRYVYQSQMEPLCYPDGGSYPDFCVKQNQNYFKWVFWAAQLLHGMGGSPFFTLAVSYLDDNLSIKESGVFLGLYYLIALVGPASGYLLGGIIVNIYVDLDKPKELSPDDTNLWVGAWWIGFLISGSISVLGVLPMFGFPKSFRGSAKKRAARTEESYGDSAQRSAQLTVTMKDFLPTARIIFGIPTFVCLTLAGTAASITITGLATFGPKLMQQFFRMAASTATLTIGLVSVPCGALGLFTGAMVIRFVTMPVQRLIWMNVGASATALALVSSFIVRCSPQLLAGVTAPYPDAKFSVGMTPNFNAPCNYNCSCKQNKFMFDPVCSADGVLHFSPCFAGCLGGNESFVLEGKRYYSNCSCISGSKLVNGLNISAVSGDCPSTECTSAPLFLALVGFFMFFMFFITIPTLQAIMRVIPSDLKDFGIGIQIVIMRLLGSIPAPLLLGRLIDTTCSVWNGSCGQQGSCIYYDAHWLWVLILLFAGGLKVIELGFFIASVLLYRPSVKQSAKGGANGAANELASNSPNVLTIEIRRRSSNAAVAVANGVSSNKPELTTLNAANGRRLSGSDNPAFTNGDVKSTTGSSRASESSQSPALPMTNGHSILGETIEFKMV